MTVASGLIGVQPAPRVLFIYDNEGSAEPPLQEVAQALMNDLRDLVPTSKLVGSAELDMVHQADYDLAFVFGDMPALDSRVHVVQFGGNFAGLAHGQGHTIQVRRNAQSVATRWTIPTSVKAEHDLVDKDLLPLVPRGAVTPSGVASINDMIRFVWASDSRVPMSWNGNTRRVLLMDVDNQPFAMVYQRHHQGGGWHWVLPVKATPLRWARFVLRHLHDQAPMRFPLRSTWSELPDYLTSDEVSARGKLAAVEAERASVLADLESREKEALAEQVSARESAELGFRRLVTTQGSDLVVAVSSALEFLGFEVTDSDKTAAEGDLLEDLQIHNDSQVALAEVRGYSGGARISDLLRISSRFAMRYLKETGQEPDRLWYIVNGLIGRPPEDRQGPLASKPDEVAAFAEQAGLVIGTEVLLKIVLRVERGEMTKDEARQSLWSATGRMTI